MVPQPLLRHHACDSQTEIPMDDDRLGFQRHGIAVAVVLATLLTFPGAALARRRVRMPPQFIAAWLGYGLSSAEKDDGPMGEGFYAEGEYILMLSEWFSPRAYAGTLITFSNADPVCRENGIKCAVSAKIGFLGVKGRLTIPIPYIAPFLELGIGTSIGTMTTRTLTVDDGMTGITYHVPFAIGLSLGEDHSFDRRQPLHVSHGHHTCQSSSCKRR